jgi:hypothetical protein
MRYNTQLEKIISDVFKNYRGVLLKREDGYWICLGQRCPTLKDCDAVINKSLEALSNSINKINHVKKEVNNS